MLIILNLVSNLFLKVCSSFGVLGNGLIFIVIKICMLEVNKSFLCKKDNMVYLFFGGDNGNGYLDLIY